MKKILIGIKSDPIENRYSFEWLFKLMKKLGIRHMQLGSFYELSLVDDCFWTELKDLGLSYDVEIRSVFTAHRETHGYYSNNRYLEQAATIVYRRMIHAASMLGARCMGSSIGSVNRDMMESKEHGTQIYFQEMKSHMAYAREQGLHSLSCEVMSCEAEAPTMPGEIDRFRAHFDAYYRQNKDTTVPLYVLGDTSHGYADKNRKVIHSNYELFERSVPHMVEFHFKNTDQIFGSTFGFSEEENRRGNVDLSRVKDILDRNQDKWPEPEMVGYLEHPGPKLGRDYSDYLLEKNLTESVESILKVFG